jgi:hypothetical protein
VERDLGDDGSVSGESHNNDSDVEGSQEGGASPEGVEQAESDTEHEHLSGIDGEIVPAGLQPRVTPAILLSDEEDGGETQATQGVVPPATEKGIRAPFLDMVEQIHRSWLAKGGLRARLNAIRVEIDEWAMRWGEFTHRFDPNLEATVLIAYAMDFVFQWVFPGRPNQEQYLAASAVLVAMLDAKYGVGGWVAVHDLASYSSGVRICEFMRDRLVRLFPWIPRRALDLRPVELLIDIMKHVIRSRGPNSRREFNGLIRAVTVFHTQEC